MPAVVPAIAGAAAFAGVQAVIGTGFAATIVAGLASAAAGGLAARAFSEHQAFDNIAQGALVNAESTVDALPVIYGTRRVGGNRIFTEVSGSLNQFLNVVIAIGEGEISAIDTVYLDDTSSAASRFDGRVTLEKHEGTDSQAASSALISETGGRWSSAHQGKGVAYLYARLKWHDGAFPSGLPTITCDVDGKLVYDPRDGTTKFSNNPALCIYDYLTNSRYGRGIPASRINEQSFIDAADYCEESVPFPTGGSPNTHARYTCDGIVDPDNGWLENLKLLLGSCRGSIIFSGGKYRLHIDRDEPANFASGTAQEGDTDTLTLETDAPAIGDFFTGGILRLTSGAGSSQERRIVDYDGGTKVATIAENWNAQYLDLPGTSGNYASTPDSEAISIAGDIDIRVKVALDDWTPAGHQGLVGKDNFPTDVGYSLRVLSGSSGLMQLFWSEDGTTTITANATDAVPASDGETIWVRATLDVDNGASGRDVKFYTSSDGETWTQLGSTVTAAGVTSIFDSTMPLKVGAVHLGSYILDGKVYYAELRNGIDGTVVAKFDPLGDGGKIGDTSFTSSTGEVWTINQSGTPAAELAGPPDGTTGYEVRGNFGFHEDNIVGSWEIRNAGKRAKFNRVRAKFFNPSRSWEPDLAVWDDTDHRSEDNGLVLEREIALPFTSNFHRAQRIAQLEERVSRFGITARFRATLEAMKFEVGDVVPITHSTPGWDAKPFRITAMQPLASGEVMVSVREYQASAYSLNSLDDEPVVPGTNLPSVVDVTAPSNVQMFSGTSELFVAGDGTVVSRIRVLWDASGDIFVQTGGRTEIQFREFAGSPSEWSPSLFFDGSMTFAYLSPVDDGRQYEVRLRFINSAVVPSDWTTTAPHTVVGKTALPSDVTGASAVQQAGLVIVGCSRVTDPDLDSIDVRYHDEGETDFDDAAPFANILRGETTTSGALPPGTWEILIKAKDTSGNYSANAARVTVTVTATGFTTIEQEAQGPDWEGTLTSMVRHWTGVIVPESQDSVSTLDWDTFDQFVGNPVEDCYYEAPVIDKGIDGLARIYGDIVSSNGPGESEVVEPSLEVDHRLNAAAFDGFEVWTVGSANFRHLKARIHVETSGGSPVIEQFTPTIDGLAREERGTLTVGAGGSDSVTFDNPFHDTPVLTVSPQGSGNVSASWDSLTATGFTGYFKSGGSAAAGTLSYHATGV